MPKAKTVPEADANRGAIEVSASRLILEDCKNAVGWAPVAAAEPARGPGPEEVECSTYDPKKDLKDNPGERRRRKILLVFCKGWGLWYPVELGGSMVGGPQRRPRTMRTITDSWCPIKTVPWQDLLGG